MLMDRSLTPLTSLNRAIRDNDVDTVTRQLGSEAGMRAVELSPGLSRWEWEARDARLVNPFGFLRGGTLASFADPVMSSAIGSLLDDGEFATTAEFKISFLKPARPGLLRAEGRVIHKGTRVAFVEARVHRADDDLMAVVSSTWTVLRSG
jgi:uncharacterized protein (TIGR00369 family)